MSLTFTIHITGPNISSLYAVISELTSIIDGATKFPFGFFSLTYPLPSNKNFPPSYSTVSSKPLILSFNLQLLSLTSA